MAEQPIGGSSVEVLADLVGVRQDEAVPDAKVYAFSPGGKLLSAAALEGGAAQLEVPSGEEPTGVRLLVGPPVEDDAASVGELLRRGAVERHLRVEPAERAVAELTVRPELWRCWLASACTVRGTVLKRVERDGTTSDWPVCDATVEIYEVDPLWVLIPRLPDPVIERIRDWLIDPTRLPPFPEPWPPIPVPDPPGIEPRPRPGPSPLALGAEPARSDLPLLAQAASTEQFRQILVDHHELLRSVICWFHPPHVTKQLLGTARTDDCGHFEFTFFRGCNNPDQPDLYFKVTQRYLFFEATIYEPKPVACHTRWNYECGREVTLYTTSPIATACPPCPPVEAGDNWVLVMAIGNLPTSRIRGVAAPLPVTPANRGFVDDGRPFGGLLRLRLEFDNSLRDSLGVRYYRVSCRRAGDPDFVPLLGECHRHYTHEAGGELTLESFQLGPQVVNGVPGLFEIPPAVPPEGQWSFPDLTEDLTSAKFPSAGLAPDAPEGQPDNAGTFELRVELFTAAGGPVDIDDLGIRYVIPRETDLSGATVIHTDLPRAGVVQGSAFVMPVHVDNNQCSAALAKPTIGGTEADDCGVLRYTEPSSVDMRYHASHRNGQAVHSFTLVRGIGAPLVPPSVSGQPVETSSSVTITRTATVASLRGACDIAAFSETVHTVALATDGWNRQSHLDAFVQGAFTLAPAE